MLQKGTMYEKATASTVVVTLCTDHARTPRQHGMQTNTGSTLKAASAGLEREQTTFGQVAVGRKESALPCAAI